MNTSNLITLRMHALKMNMLIRLKSWSWHTCQCSVTGRADENCYSLYRKIRNVHFLPYLLPCSVLLLTTCYILYTPGLYEVSCVFAGASDVSAENQEESCCCGNVGILVTLEPLHEVLWGWSCYADQRVSRSRTKVSIFHGNFFEN
jgi:hypothetical protein